MAVYSRRSTDKLLMPSKWSERSDQQSPEKSAIWSEQPKCNSVIYGTVPVVYYLSRNGQLDHPHFIQVPLSSSHGLFLRDVLIKLNFIRGNGMPYMYSWSSKRSYKNGYVWQDLAEDDFIRPTNDRDYILKGSELRQAPAADAAVRLLQPATTDDAHDSSIPRSSKSRQKIQSWSTFENSIKNNHNNNLDEYRQVCKSESSRELGGAKSVDMGTQTEASEARRSKSTRAEVYANKSVELSREDLSPPSISSSERLDGASGSGDVDRCASDLDPMVQNECTSGRSKPKPSRVLKQLISCGSTVRDCSASIKQKKNGYKMRPKCGRSVLRDVVDR